MKELGTDFSGDVYKSFVLSHKIQTDCEILPSSSYKSITHGIIIWMIICALT